ncbi:MAG TPA: hypothetical protein VF893_05490 [Candidatus Bathyarchaeia archaeon]
MLGSDRKSILMPKRLHIPKGLRGIHIILTSAVLLVAGVSDCLKKHKKWRLDNLLLVVILFDARVRQQSQTQRPIHFTLGGK